MSQGQALRVLNESAGPSDWLVVASGTPHVDVHKLWDAAAAARCLMEVGFSCMGGEIPAALGVRMAEPDAGEVFVGDRRRDLPDGRRERAGDGPPGGPQADGARLRERRLPVDPRAPAQPHRQELRARVPDRRSGLTATTWRSTTPPTPAASAARPRRADARAAARRPRRGARRAGAGGDLARVEPQRLLLDSNAGGTWACPRRRSAPRPAGSRPSTRAAGRSSAAHAAAVRIVATAEVPAVAREAFAPLGEIVVRDDRRSHRCRRGGADRARYAAWTPRARRAAPAARDRAHGRGLRQPRRRGGHPPRHPDRLRARRRQPAGRRGHGRAAVRRRQAPAGARTRSCRAPTGRRATRSPAWTSRAPASASSASARSGGTSPAGPGPSACA